MDFSPDNINYQFIFVRKGFLFKNLAGSLRMCNIMFLFGGV